ncbi:hypothetical protein ABBQ32_002021 [Trebouxia sp. C0010 RCD-2024]
MTSLLSNPAQEGNTVLSAILLADSFAQEFTPVTLERPKMLLPLVNLPMMDYTLEWLATAGVTEVLVVCCAHAEQVEAHLKASNWAQRKFMKLTVLTAAACLSPGDALRFVDQKDLMKNDFVFVTGDVVASFDLQTALASHKQRQAADRHAIMTMVMQSAHNTYHRTWSGDTETLVLLEPQVNRLIRLEDMDSSNSKKSTILDAEHFSGHNDLMLRTDLLNLHVYICAPEVLLLFSDNFDYQNVEQDFISGVLSEEELGNTIHVYELEAGFAGQVRDLRSYEAVSQAILQRWSFPFALDNWSVELHGAQSESGYGVKRHNCYRGQDIKLARTAILGRDSVLGAGTSVDEGSQVRNSVIGRDCHIGKGVHIHGCYIHNGVTICDGAQLQSAVVCDGAVIMSEAVLCSRCIVSYQVVIAAGHKVPADALISLCPHQYHKHASLHDDEVEYSSAGQMAGSPAAGGDQASHDSEQRSNQLPSAAVKAAAQALAQGRQPSVHVDFDEESVGRGGAGFAWPQHSGLEEQPLHLPKHSPGSHTSDSDEESVHDRDRDHAESVDHEASFKKEVTETFLRCVKMGYEQDLAVIELNGLKIAEDRTFADCARHVFASILDLCLPSTATCKAEYQSLFPPDAPNTDTQAGRAELLHRLSVQLNSWAPLLQRFLKSEDEQVELLLTLEEYCEEEGRIAHSQCCTFQAVFQQVLKLLYDMEVLEEDAIIMWADEKQMATEDDRKYLKKAATFVSWLREAEAEGSTSDDSE